MARFEVYREPPSAGAVVLQLVTGLFLGFMACAAVVMGEIKSETTRYLPKNPIRFQEDPLLFGLVVAFFAGMSLFLCWRGIVDFRNRRDS